MSMWRCAHVIRPWPTRPVSRTIPTIENQSTPWIAPISVAFAMDVAWYELNPTSVETPKITPGTNTAFDNGRLTRPPVKYAAVSITGIAINSRQNTIVPAEASIPRTISGPNPHAKTAIAAIEIARRARPSEVFTISYRRQKTLIAQANKAIRWSP